MTTENESVETEATPKHAAVTRSVDILLSLDTYQGMTDAEIQSLIDWHVKKARNDEVVLAEYARIDVVGMEAVNAYRKVAEDSQKMLELAMNNQPELRKVSYDGA